MMYSRRGYPRFPDLRPIGTPIPDSRPNRESGIPCFPIPGQIGNRGFPPRFLAKSGIGGTGIQVGESGLSGLPTELATSHSVAAAADMRWRPEISIFEDQRQHLAPGSCLVLTWDEYPRFPDFRPNRESGIP